jgi:cytochrome c oxidase assembly factor CtaG
MGWWTWEPVVIALLALTAMAYAIGAAKTWRHAPRLSMASFALGWLALVVALVSPVDALGSILFSAHMVQHELLMIVAAPLLVFGRPLATMLWALPPRGRAVVGRTLQRAMHALTQPLLVTTAHAAALWIWHLPALYQATLRSEWIHALQHTSFLFTATFFWWAMLHGRYGRIGYGMAVVYVFITGLHSGLLGALIAFSPNLWYPIYDATTARWGLDAMEDQQLAGFVMWIPAGLLLSILGVALFAAWLGEAERRMALSAKEPE